MSDEELKVRIGGDASGLQGALGQAGQAVHEFGAHLHKTFDAGDIFKDLAVQVASIIGPLELLHKAGEAVFEGLNKAQEMRDNAAAMKALSSSTEAAAAAMEFFEKAQSRTRNTTMELSKLYMDVLPIAMKRFGEQGVQSIIMQLAQIAPIARKSAAEMEEAFKMLLAGRVRGTNPILTTLGISKDEFKKAGFDDLTAKLSELAKKGEELGDTMQSAGAKIKDEFLEAFGAGFNAQLGAATGGIAKLREELTSPEVLKAINNIGQSVAYVIGAVGMLAEKMIGYEQTIFGTIEGIAGSALQHIAEGLAKVFKWIDTAIAFYTGDNSPQKTDKWLTDLIAGGKGMKDAGFDTAAEGVNKLTGSYKALNIEFGKTVAVHDKGGGPLDTKKIDAARKAVSDLTRSLIGETGLAKAQEAVAAAQTPAKKWIAEYGVEMEKVSVKAAETTKKIDEQAKVLGASSSLILQARSALAGYVAEQTKLANMKLLEHGQSLLKETFATWNKEDLAGLDQGLTAIHEKILEKYRKHFEQLAANFQSNFMQPMSNMLGDFATTGGKNFGQIAAQNFNRLAADGAGKMADIIASAFGGGTVDQQKGTINGKAAKPEDIERANRVNKNLGMGMTAASVGIGAYQQGKQNTDGSIMTGALSGAMAGATFSIWGAVVGAIVGGVMAAVGKAEARKDYKGGTPMIDAQGNATFLNAHLNKEEAAQMLARITATYDEFRNGYVKLLLKLPEGIIPAIKAIDGKFQDGPSKNYLKHFEEWLNGTLPAQIADQFKDAMSVGFVKMGMSVGKFSELWTKFNALDPKKALELWNIVADTMKNIQKLQEFFQSNGQYGSISGPLANPMSIVHAEATRSIVDEFSQGFDHIKEVAGSLSSLVGEDQVRGAQELTQLMQNKMEEEKRGLRQLYDLATSFNETIQGMKRQLKVDSFKTPDGKPDYDKQLKFVTDYYNTVVLPHIANATNAQDLGYWSQQATALTQQMSSIAQSAGPEAFAAVSDWLSKDGGVLDQLNTLVQTRATQLGVALAAAGQSIFDAVQPALNEFTGNLGASSSATSAATSAQKEYTAAVVDSTERIKKLTEQMEGFAHAAASARARRVA